MPASLNRGRAIVLSILGLMIAFDLVVVLFLPGGRAEAEGPFVRFVLSVALVYCIYRGYVWARVLGAILLALAGIACLALIVILGDVAGLSDRVWLICISGLPLAGAAMLLFLPSVRAFVDKQRLDGRPPMPPLPATAFVIPSCAPAAGIPSVDPIPMAIPLDAPGVAPPSLPVVPPLPVRRPLWMFAFSCMLLVLTGAFALAAVVKAGREGQLVISETVGGFVGAGLIALLVGWLVWRLACRKRPGAGLLWFSMVLIVVSYQGVLMRSPRQSYDLDAVKETFAALVDNAMEGKDVAEIKIDERRLGPIAGIARAIQEGVGDVASATREYREEIEELALQDVLNQEVMESPERIADARLRIKKGLQTMREHWPKVLKVFQETPQRLTRAGVSGEALRGAMEGFRGELEHRCADLAEFRRIDMAILAQDDAILEFLSEREGEYSFRDGYIVFVSDEDTETYCGHLDRLNRLIAEEDAWRTRLRNEARKKLDELDKLKK